MYARLYWDNVEYLNFGGGGINALAELGCLNYITSLILPRGFKGQIKGVCGTSAGSAVAALWVMCDYDTEEVAQLASKLECWELYNPQSASFAPLRQSNAMVSKKSGQVHLKNVIKSKTGNGDITLSEFSAVYGVEFKAEVHNLITGCNMLLSSADHPELPLSDALWASMAIPWLHEPLITKELYLVDGGVGTKIAAPFKGCTHSFHISAGTTPLISVARKVISMHAKGKINPEDNWGSMVCLNLCLGVACISSVSTFRPSNALCTTAIKMPLSFDQSLVRAVRGNAGVQEIIYQGWLAQQVWSAYFMVYLFIVANLAQFYK